MPRETLRDLASLPATADLVEATSKLLQRSTVPGGGISASPRVVRSAVARLERGFERDRLQGQRPSGCECLGVGVVGTAYCACPEGTAAQAEREQRDRAARRNDVAGFIARAGIPQRFRSCTFDSYPGSQSALSTVKAFAEAGQFSVFLYGGYGVGKTGIAVSLLKARVERECEAALFVTVPNLLDAIRRGYAEKSTEQDSQMLDRAKRVRYLVLDDIGAERVTDWVADRLALIIGHRHDEELATAFTSNLTLDQLAGRVGERTGWRIAEMCEVINVNGRNLRERRQ